jgi:prophage antirepressor-like protein
MSNQNIILFENRQVRRYYDTEKDIWYFSIVDIVKALTESVNPTDYLKKLRKRDFELGAYLGTNCPQIEMLTNGKRRKTLAGTVKDIFRIIQSIPSPQAEPFKQWLAKVGYERIQEINDLGQGIDRARENWQKLGRSEMWIQQRMTLKLNINRGLQGWKSSFPKATRMA